MRKQIIGLLAGVTLLAMGAAVGSAADADVSQPVQSAQPSASPTQTASPDSTQKPLFIGNTTKIADKAYTGRKDLRVVVIESGVTEIGARAFDGCTNLGLVFIPKSVTQVGKKAFNQCPNLLVLMESGIAQSVVDEMYQQELQFRIGPTYKAGEKLVINPYRIGYPQVGRYWSVNNIRYKVVKKTDTEREVVAMNLSYAKNSDKNKVKKVVIPNTVALAGKTYRVVGVNKNAFKGLKKLTTVTIGKNVRNIGAKAFYGCKKLKTVKIQTKKCTFSGKSIWKKTSKKLVVKVPKSVLKKMRKQLKKSGLKAKAVKAA